MVYPKVLGNTIEYLKKLPGIGDKTAERLALSLIDMSNEEVNSLSLAIADCKNKMNKCTICGCLTENDLCDVCLSAKNGERNANVICILEDYKGVFAFEKSGKYNGTYHVLNGLISPIDGIGPDDINLASLIRRVESLDHPEVIIALKSTIEGETTTLYLKKKLESKNVVVSRLSYGIPMGVEIDYLDEMTLQNALDDRKIIS